MRYTRLSSRAATAAALVLGATACADLSTAPSISPASAPRRDVTSGTQLALCPSEDGASSRAWIGQDGGRLRARGSSISIPAGAVLEPTLFEIEVPASRYMKVEIHAVGRSDYQFARPATITINFSRCPSGAIPYGATIGGAYVDSATGAVLQLMGGTVDWNGDKLSFPTDHLSGYVVAY
jgi:hypothetical protein